MALEYLRAQTQLQLDQELPPGLDPVGRFLSGSPRLFVYKVEGKVKASNDAFETPHQGCVCYSSAKGGAITKKNQIGVLSFPPSIDDSSDSSNPLLQTLQSYSSCFLPAVKSVWDDTSGKDKKLSNFSSKVREFDVVLDQMKVSHNCIARRTTLHLIYKPQSNTSLRSSPRYSFVSSIPLMLGRLRYPPTPRSWSCCMPTTRP